MPENFAAPVPLAVLTGFLGAGKSTRLSRLLALPQMARAAVLVNEFGEVGIDHHLIDLPGDRMLLLANGCLCCEVRDELSDSLLRLAARRLAGKVDFDRVVVETSGLADPGPLLAMLSAGGRLAANYDRAAVVALVDALAGAETIASMPGAARQVALADRIFITKTDIARCSDELSTLLRRTNPDAPITADGDPAVEDLFSGPIEPFRAGAFSAQWIAADGHADGISATAIVDAEPLPAALLPLLLEGLARHCGDRLLRVKGIVNVVESPAAPLLIQGARRHEIERRWLDRWPDNDRRTRISIIGTGIPPRWPSALLACLRAEMRLLGKAARSGA